MRIMADFKHDFDTLVTRGKLQVISLQETVGRIKIQAEQTKSQELKTAVNQIEEKVGSLLKMFFNIPKSELVRIYAIILLSTPKDVQMENRAMGICDRGSSPYSIKRNVLPGANTC